ncbi:hypothetical protein EIP91_005364 [Steccherinum ochraceum]|uniref:TRP C-terminal domain-containing protein n=1 Tax=Steccherinum ochraceum TaxID=92696 RepID=A0A4R0R7K2_9APHY|nr:hypothetical protein EIP91_005364 [Steccherinum ochraceum]
MSGMGLRAFESKRKRKRPQDLLKSAMEQRGARLGKEKERLFVEDVFELCGVRSKQRWPERSLRRTANLPTRRSVMGHTIRTRNKGARRGAFPLPQSTTSRSFSGSGVLSPDLACSSLLQRQWLPSHIMLGLPGLLLLLLSLAVSYVNSQPAPISFQDCFTGNVSQKLNVSTIYAQFFEHTSRGPYFNLTLLGESPQAVIGASEDVNPVATTLFTTTEMLTFVVWDYSAFFCATVRPPSPLPQPNDQGNYCPLPAGPFALSTSIQPGNSFELATFYTRLRALDPFKNELFCLDLNTTPLAPSLDSPYGRARIILWSTVALAIGYWLVVGLARLISAWDRGTRGAGVWAKVERVGFVMASAVSGEKLATSPALMRFCTPSLRDIIFHTQFCAALAMVAVQWPDFIYPLLSQTAWSTLSYNISVTQGSDSKHWNPLTVPLYSPPSNFADQLNDSNSPIFIDATAPNVLFQLPADAKPGISSFAYAVGVFPQDLFGICLALFLAIVGATIVLSMIVWLLDWVASRGFGSSGSAANMMAGTRSPRYSAGSKDVLESIGHLQGSDENKSVNGHFLFRTTSRFPGGGRPWWRLRNTFVSLHGSVLQGNLVRILILFHLPVTIFSCYQFTIGRSSASLASIILAALSFAILSVALPIFLILRLQFTNTAKLYDETWTLLFLGPLYNHYRHGSQLFACLLFATNLAFGITIGCGQKSGTAQAIVILVVEVISALVTSVWLPWGQGASMGLISFLFCVARIVIAVLLVILTPIVSVGAGAAQWVAYAILFILGLIYLAFTLMLVVKLVEAVVRMIGGVGFHRSRHVVDSGLFGALGMTGCCGSRRSGHHRHRRHNVRPEDPSSPSTLPLSRPNAPYKDVTPTPSGPPSVLRPENVQPYKEESDDETGYIMGAWQPFPRPGYSTVSEPSSRTPEVPKSGFARVGGGRAHYDSPYAITQASGSGRFATGSTQTFPSVERKDTMGSAHEYSPPPTPSISSVAKKATEINNLPPGAMPPAHIRTKSQTAIIEDPSGLPFGSQPMPTRLNLGGDVLSDGEDDEHLGTQPRKKHWYNIRKPRSSTEPEATAPELSPPPPSDPSPGRSFVVVRKQRPGTAGSQAPSAGPSSSDEPAPRSFTVLRGPEAR